MITSIPFKIGPSRDSAGNRLAGPPQGIEVPRPFDVRHLWREPAGRSTGGFYYLATYDGMDWAYEATGHARHYPIFRSLYNPRQPFVWVQYYDLYSNAGRWIEAVMLEPHLELGAGATITGMLISFRSIRYE